MASTDSAAETVRLLVAHDRNRDLLAEWLADTYEVVTGPGSDDAADSLSDTDLCLVDDRGFAAHRERLRAWKDEADPVFAPVVLVTDQPPGEGLDPEDWETLDGLYVVDDVVQVPVEQAVLFRRLENLLSRRTLSSDLARSYKRAEERFASLFHATPDPALVLSEGHVLYVNDAFCEQFGVEREDTHWRHLRELDALTDEARRQIGRQVDCALADSDAEADASDVGLAESAVSDGGDSDTDPGTASTGDASPESTDDRTETVVVRRADGEKRYVETNVKPMILEDRRNVAVVMRDVTGRRRRKQELERKNERLEQFTSIVSHDLRNPIQVLDGRLSHLEQLAPEEGNVADQVDPMRRSVDRMSTLVDDMLTLARQGAAVKDVEAVALGELAREAWTTTDAPAATLRVESDLTVAADASRLRQLFENCYRNAVDHGADDVTVTVGDLPDGAGFYVADDGPGIPPEERDSVFELGYSPGEGGTGLGLGIVSNVVDAHGWEISATESETGGARFEIRTG